MDTDNDLIFGLGVLAALWLVFCGSVYGAYRYGRFVERRVLYGAMVASLEATYADGYNDGVNKGITKGWADGVRECDNDDLYSGRY